MNYSYKMKYASYLETLTPEQQNAELSSSVGKNLKRMAAKKTEDGQVMLKLNFLPFNHIKYDFFFSAGG